MNISNFLQSGFEFNREENELRLKYILFNCLIACNVVFVTIACVFRFSTGQNIQGTIDLSYVIFALSIAFIARRSKKYFPLLITSIIILSLIIVSLSYKNSFNSICGISWFIIIILITYYFSNKKTTYLVSIISIFNIIYISIENKYTYSLSELFYGIIPLLVVVCFNYFYENVNSFSRREHFKVKSELEKQISRKNIELSVSEEKFRNLIENLSDWVWETDKDGIYTYSSPSVTKLLGYSPDEIEGISCRKLMCEVHRSDNIDFLEQCSINHGPIKGQIIEVRHKEGFCVALEVSGKPIFDVEGYFSGYHGVSRDISARMEVEKTRREAKKKIDTLLNATVDMAFLADSAGTFLAVNRALSEEIGVGPEKILGRSIFDFGILKTRATQFHSVMVMKKPLHCEEEYNGRFLDNSLYPILDDNGFVIQVAVFSKDVTAVKRAGEERERLLRAIGQSSEAIVITDRCGDIEYVNPAFTRITGYSREEVLGRNPKILKSGKHGERFYKTMWDTLVNGESWCGNFINKKKDGSFYTEEATISPVKNKLGNIINYVAVKRDISQEIKAEKQKIKLEEQLHQKYKMEAIGVMAGGIAHNFNNNLAIILGSIELLKKNLENDQVSDRYLDNAITAALRSRDLIQQIMVYSRHESQNKVVISPLQIINETLKLVRPIIPSSVKFKKNINSKSLKYSIYADPTQIQECLVNICNNSLHAMESGGTLVVSLDVVNLDKTDIPAQYESAPGVYLKISIRDTGVGMSQDTVNKIFDLFFTTKDAGEGTGIGLSTVLGIVKRHGGLIKVDSALGEGSLFDLFFPAVDSLVSEKKLPSEVSPITGKEKILLVDDEEVIVRLGAEILSAEGYQVTSMTDSVDALEHFTKNPDFYDMVITDQTMPHLLGVDLIRKIKEIRPEIPTILCTGCSEESIFKQTPRGGKMDVFYMKPLESQELLEAVRSALDMR